MKIRWSFLALALMFLTHCQSGSAPTGTSPSPPNTTTTPTSGASRSDGAKALQIQSEGSLQNAAFSPDGKEILFTNFTKGYNKEPADLKIFNRETQNVRTLVSNGCGNVNLPGSVWDPKTGKIIYTSSCDPHEEVFSISSTGDPGSVKKLTSRDLLAAWEPSFAPDGIHFVFESHKVDVPEPEDKGLITKYIDGQYLPLTEEADDCRQPNWSPTGDLIVYQCVKAGQWDLWVMSPDGTGKKQVTTGSGNKTDASFSPDGKQLVYSSDEGGLPSANLFVIPVAGGSSQRVTNFSGYDGAPSWSLDGSTIAFESFPGDPDGSAGTTLWTIPAPK